MRTLGFGEITISVGHALTFVARRPGSALLS